MVTSFMRSVTLLALLLMFGVETNADHRRQIIELEDAAMFVVFNAVDDDTQIFVEVPNPGEAIKTLSVRGPDGTRPVQLKIRDENNLGMSEMIFETPEPSIEDLAKAYPEGKYSYFGRTVEGNRFLASIDLDYKLLDAPVITFPTDGTDDVSTSGLTALWEPIEGAEAIRFEVEDEEAEVSFKADLPGDATMFNFPEGWLQGGVLYTMDIKAIGENGNQTVVDARFTTAE